MKTKEPKINRTAVRLLQRHLKQGDKGRTLFKESGDSLNQALAYGLPLNTPIKLKGGRLVFIKDQFETTNSAFAAKVFQRFTVQDWKVPKAPKAGTTPADSCPPNAASEVAA